MEPEAINPDFSGTILILLTYILHLNRFDSNPGLVGICLPVAQRMDQGHILPLSQMRLFLWAYWPEQYSPGKPGNGLRRYKLPFALTDSIFRESRGQIVVVQNL